MNMLKQHMMHPKKCQRGAVAIVVGICIVVLVGMIGLVVDMGHLFVFKTELQNAADSCALAAAKELDGGTDALTRAQSAGITVGQQNKADLQGTAVSISPANIKFSATLSPNSNYLTLAAGANPATAKYAMCTITRTGIGMWFMQVMGFGNQTVAAEAVATVAPSQTTCAIPLGLCKPATPPASCPDGSLPEQNMCKGDWLSGLFSSGGGITGNFNWIAYPDTPGGEPGVAAMLTGPGKCDLPTVGTTLNAETGTMGNAAKKAWNSRFGLYQPGGGAGNPNPTTAPPDRTGFAYTKTPKGISAWPTQRNALSDFRAKQSSHTQYQGDASTGLKVSPPYSSASLINATTDRRLPIAPVVDCSTWGPSHTITLKAWACVLLLHPAGPTDGTLTLEYRGMSSDANSPCASYGIPGGTVGPMVPALVQ